MSADQGDMSDSLQRIAEAYFSPAPEQGQMFGSTHGRPNHMLTISTADCLHGASNEFCFEDLEHGQAHQSKYTYTEYGYIHSNHIDRLRDEWPHPHIIGVQTHMENEGEDV